MTSYGYITMAIVDSCMIWFNFDCIIQLKKSYRIATNVCSRKVLLLLVISLTVDFQPLASFPDDINVLSHNFVALDMELNEDFISIMLYNSLGQSNFVIT